MSIYLVIKERWLGHNKLEEILFAYDNELGAETKRKFLQENQTNLIYIKIIDLIQSLQKELPNFISDDMF